uniref:Uncharacterized protein n=1 Tax=Glossina pallidipes TaxID=7398 RepID=A0A1A9Z2Y3_GLOPL
MEEPMKICGFFSKRLLVYFDVMTQLKQTVDHSSSTCSLRYVTLSEKDLMAETNKKTLNERIVISRYLLNIKSSIFDRYSTQLYSVLHPNISYRLNVTIMNSLNTIYRSVDIGDNETSITYVPREIYEQNFVRRIILYSFNNNARNKRIVK